jgi:hypothetical protein
MLGVERFQVEKERAKLFISPHIHLDVEFKIYFSDICQTFLFYRGLIPNNVSFLENYLRIILHTILGVGNQSRFL